MATSTHTIKINKLIKLLLRVLGILTRGRNEGASDSCISTSDRYVGEESWNSLGPALFMAYGSWSCPQSQHKMYICQRTCNASEKGPLKTEIDTHTRHSSLPK